MWEDPIVAEVHRAREKLAAECNFDISAFFAGVRSRQAASGSTPLSQQKPAEPLADADPGHSTHAPGSMSSGAAPAA